MINLDEQVTNGLIKMIDNLAKPLTENVQAKPGFHICNIITGECVCWEYVWNSSIRDKCRHCHAAKLYKNAKEKGFIEIVNEAKEQLVTYFRNNERVLLANLKNYVIYQNTVENAFKEIVRLYEAHGKVLLKYYYFTKKIILKSIIYN